MSRWDAEVAAVSKGAVALFALLNEALSCRFRIAGRVDRAGSRGGSAGGSVATYSFLTQVRNRSAEWASPALLSQAAYSCSGSCRCSVPKSGMWPNSIENELRARFGRLAAADHPVERRGQPGPVSARLAVDQQADKSSDRAGRSTARARGGLAGGLRSRADRST